MTDELVLRLLARLHGHAGWLAVAALLHPVIVLRSPMRRARGAAWASTLLVSAVAGLGAGLYPSYRALLKQAIFQQNPTVGWWFERKEHLAVGAVTFAWIGLLCHLAAARADSTSQKRLAALAHRAYAAAFFLALSVATIGTIAAANRSF
ncbi:hypothetical protein LBMAG42_23180 [Deltaproteobacteria bacterium]|nr:hypothetical protein LBMAG42_23180 [Deltaproteobacteria bacterium]